MEQRRLLIALGLSLLLVLVYNEVVLRRYPRRPRPAPAEEVAKEAQPPSAVTPPPGSVPAPAPAQDLTAPLDTSDMVVVDTDLLHLNITPQGARLATLQLKRFRQTVARDSPPLELVQQSPLLPLTLALGAGSDAHVTYRPDRTELSLSGSERGEIVFTGRSSDGLDLTKRFAFTGDGYVFDVTAETSEGHGSEGVGLLLTPVAVQGSDQTGRIGAGVGIALANSHLTEKPLADLQKQPSVLDAATWAGFAAQYFLMVAIPEQGLAQVEMTAVDGAPVVRIRDQARAGRVAFSIFAGPKEREVLSSVGHDLDRAIDFGWFWFIAIPLLWALRKLHAITGNYGVAIILLTAMVKLATTPLTRTTFRNMREMQKIQPQMAKLRERYKDDQVALQKEMMDLYKRHRVNPFSGCLPMILQLPIFVGLYNALSHAIELRHAPFFLWIRDLSAPDQLMVGSIGIPVLVILMGATMFVQQWMTPQQGDPAQQRMMMFMPLVFTFMFLKFPAGLVLYWLVNNVLTIAQQYSMMRTTT